ncbi:MAG: MoaF C-terminal domain-containing protein [Specibacter sp.]
MNEVPEFISVGALGEGFAVDSNILPENSGLDGRSLTLRFHGGRVHECAIRDGGTVAWDGREFTGRITSIRNDIYFVDFLIGEDAKESVSLVVDTSTGQVTMVEGSLPDEAEAFVGAFERVRDNKELTGVGATISHGTLDGGPGGVPHAPTEELVGLRNRYRYSPGEVYEHVYLNENSYTWHCLEGSERGLCDTDRCHYIKVAEKLYLFIWREKIIPTLGVILIDMDRLKTDGKIFGHKGFDFTSYVNFKVGAAADVLNETRY